MIETVLHTVLETIGVNEESNNGQTQNMGVHKGMAKAKRKEKVTLRAEVPHFFPSPPLSQLDA